jgi:hypothetical protein
MLDGNLSILRARLFRICVIVCRANFSRFIIKNYLEKSLRMERWLEVDKLWMDLKEVGGDVIFHHKTICLSLLRWCKNSKKYDLILKQDIWNTFELEGCSALLFTLYPKQHQPWIWEMKIVLWAPFPFSRTDVQGLKGCKCIIWQAEYEMLAQVCTVKPEGGSFWGTNSKSHHLLYLFNNKERPWNRVLSAWRHSSSFLSRRLLFSLIEVSMRVTLSKWKEKLFLLLMKTITKRGW